MRGAAAVSAVRDWARSWIALVRPIGTRLATWGAVGWLKGNADLDRYCGLFAMIALAAGFISFDIGASSTWAQSLFMATAFMFVSSIFTIAIVNVIVERNERDKSAEIESLLMGQARRAVGRVLLECASSLHALDASSPPPPVPDRTASMDELLHEFKQRQRERRRRLLDAVDGAWDTGPFTWYLLLNGLDSQSDRVNRIALAARDIMPTEIESSLHALADAIDYLLESRWTIEHELTQPPEVRRREFQHAYGQRYIAALRAVVMSAYAIQNQTPEQSRDDEAGVRAIVENAVQ